MKSKRSEVFNRFAILLWVIVFVVIAAVLVVSFSSERQISSGEGGTQVVTKIESITCKSADILYPFLTFDESVSKELKIVVAFEEEKINAISLQQTLYYNNPELVTQSEAVNHAEMNASFGKNGLGADALNANYAILSDAMRLGLYGRSEDLDGSALQYFLIDEGAMNDYNSTKAAYEALGMDCVDNKT